VAVSLRGQPVEQTVTLPDGRVAAVWVGVADDPYIDRKEIDTVALELRVDGEVAAALNTVLEPEHESEALALAREITAKLGSGELDPTAGALEPLVDATR
jgi:hypothetical protein